MVRFRKSDEFRQSGFSPTRLISAPFRKLFNLLSRKEGDLANSADQSPLRRVLTVLLFPFTFIWMLLGFIVTTWSTSRSGKAFLLGLPALAVSASVFTGIGIANHFYRNIVYNRYEGAANKHLINRKPNLAIFYLERLIRELPDETRFKFLLGLAHNELENKEEAFRIMQVLAPVDQPGDSRAHQWLATYYVETQSDELTENDRLELAKQHLLLALRTDREDLRVRLQLASIQERLGEVDEALRGYRMVIDHEFAPGTEVFDEYVLFLSQAGPPLIRLMIEHERNRSRAKLYEEKVISRVRGVLANNPDNIQAWRLIVLCQLGMKDYQGAVKTIEQARQSARSNLTRAQLQVLLADLFLEYADGIEKNGSAESFENEFRAVAKAVELNFRNGRAIDKLIAIAINPETEPVNAEQLIKLSQSSSMVSPLVLHTILSARGAIAGKLDEAIAHLKIANGINPAAAGIANSIASRLMVEPNNRPADALTVINITLEVWPEVPNLYHTRGEVYMRLERLDEAEKELLYALEQLPEDIPLRKSLVNCYESLGQPANAEIHRVEFERLMAAATLARRN